MAFNYSLCATTQAFSRRFKHIKQKQKMKKNVQSLDYTPFDYVNTYYRHVFFCIHRGWSGSLFTHGYRGFYLLPDGAKPRPGG